MAQWVRTSTAKPNKRRCILGTLTVETPSTREWLCVFPHQCRGTPYFPRTLNNDIFL